MLNKKLKLNKNIFSEDVEAIPIRKGYGEGLLIAGEQNSKIVALCADLTESTQTHFFKKKFPDRFVQMGIGEQSMASVASGLAAMGKIPFFTSYAMFSPGRNWEQIRTTICYNNVNAKIVGSHAGVSVGPDGGTHQALEDIAITRVIPRMTVLSPCDAIEANKATIEAARHRGPVYIRLAREATPVITSEETEFAIGKVYVLWESKEPMISIFATGSLVHEALLTAKELDEKEGVGSIVINVPTIKPLDKSEIVKNVKRTGIVITIEEHQVNGGLGSAICEILSELLPTPVIRIGVEDKFGQSGNPSELVKHYGLDHQSIIKKIKDTIS